ncbi:hypothetical protein FH972_000931 [Carpinus fangiana]|uniref:Uncharacterized protein n=1 Tax=Carpinus fangiana TaxID=176857 RepID=A0A5N6QC08_9ROSI|nr:hypothetical protein FH972_000931 [Carpinus fangiana]
MDERKEDVRIYVVSILFFACIVAGGFLLCLYIFLPQTNSTSLYPVAGLILVGIPWAFWFLACLYRCCKRRADQQPDECESNRGPSPPAAPASGATIVANTSNEESPARTILLLANREMEERLKTPTGSSEPCSPALKSPVYSPTSGLYMKRSLQCFLQKRKHRIQATSPYNH